jgi:Na+/proline symporter
VAVRVPDRPGLLARALARARTGVAGITPVDRTAVRIQRVLVMAVLVGGWALSLSFPRFILALPLMAVVLLAATVHPSLSLPRLISARLLPATRLAGPWLTTEDPAPHRLGDAVMGLVLVLASLCAILGAPFAAWAIGWAVIVVSLVEFTFDVSLGALVHSRLRRTRVLRI